MRSTRFAIYSVAVVLVACGCGSTSAAPSTSRSDARLYHRMNTGACLLNKHVIAQSLDVSKLSRAVIRVTGVTGAITFLSGPIPGIPHSGPTIDAGALVFLRTSDDATRSEATLAQTFVFHKGEGTIIHALQPSPPTKAALNSVQRVARNVVVFWEWPRKHADSSDRIVNACLAASLR